MLLVGDAIAAADPMTGEGIGQALLTGRLAADALSAHLGDPASVLRAYERSIQRQLVPDHHLANRLSRILAHESVAHGSLRIAAMSDWTRRNFGRWLFEDEPRAALFTPRRWHRSFLRRPGARLPER